MNFGQAIGSFWTRYFDFQGRSSRSEYWWAVLFIALLFVPLFIFEAIYAESTGMYYSWQRVPAFELLEFLLSTATTIPLTSLAVRRLHDISRSGWWCLLPVTSLLFLADAEIIYETKLVQEFSYVFFVLALVGSYILLIVWACLPGHKKNEFGNNPLTGK